MTKVTSPIEQLPKVLQDLINKHTKAEEGEEETHQFFQVPMITDDKLLEQRGILLIDKPISKETISQVTNKLLTLQFDDKFDEEVQIIINSPGGYLDATWAFIDAMESVRFPIRTIAMGEICSAAVMIFIAGDTRVMSPNSVAMIHHFSTFTGGSYPELLANRKSEDLQAIRMVRHFIHNSRYNTPKEVIDNILLGHNNWLSPREMKKHGLCDIVMKAKVRDKKKVIKKKKKK